jgi:23S rRNA A2030 N6-methylase RlmJ
MNGSGMLLLNPPFGIEERLPPVLAALRATLEEGDGRGDWLMSWPRPRA